MKIQILIAALCFVFGLALGIFTEHRLNPVQVFDCEVIDYSQIEQIVAKQVATHQVQPLDVEKIKHVKSFTYAPVYSVQLVPPTVGVAGQDSVLKQIITQAAFLHPKPK
ncbi:hypothetical protein QNI19_35510 [Cytophagaceae bacterium DM2B3-1]|uniref:DUF4230 domain-containing protein n=1 Tax=Xanthocytophaga flava TaxID=3048013 RepID=A0ABT7CX29_9BACT|nr:hypothetical protein [Xanthocytophaga flavus]MDJ1498297.1 hypothetical protein [Xanthocytophaga flavus]